MNKIRINNTIHDAIKLLNERIQDYELRIKILSRVERVTKKNGDDFAILSKNFKNIGTIDGDCMKIYSRYEDGRYITETVNITIYEEDAKNDERIKRLELIERPYLKNYYILSPEMIIERIKTIILNYIKQLDFLKLQLSSIETAVKNYYKNYYKMMEQLHEDAKSIILYDNYQDNTLTYFIKKNVTALQIKGR